MKIRMTRVTGFALPNVSPKRDIYRRHPEFVEKTIPIATPIYNINEVRIFTAHQDWP